MRDERETANRSSELLNALDNAPFTRRHGVLYGTVLAGHFLDGFVINTTGVVLPTVIPAFHLTSGEAGYLSSALFLGMLVGAAIAGMVSDRLGRKFPLAACLLVFAGFSVLAALSWNYPSLMTARFLQGIGLGAEIAVVLPYITEFVPSRHRAPLVTMATGAWLIGLPVAALVGAAVVPSLGWRAMFVIGVVPVLVSVAVALFLPESVRYLLRGRRYDDARRIVTSLTGTAALSTVPRPAGAPSSPLPGRPADVDTPQEPAPRPAARAGAEPGAGTGSRPAGSRSRSFSAGSVRQLVSGTYLRYTVSLWFMELCAGAFLYGLSTWLPSVLEKKGIGLLGSLSYTAVITAAGVLGAIIAGYTVKRIGRRSTIGFSFLLSGVFCLWWGTADTTCSVVVLGCVATFFGSGFAGSTLFVYASEIYPTFNRATGLGWAAAWQKVGGLVIPTVIGWVLALHSSSYIFFVLFAVISILAGASGFLATFETRGKTIEQITESMSRGAQPPPVPPVSTGGVPTAPATAAPVTLTTDFTATYDQESGR
ncbi:MFS transporter [Streptomyces sp. DW26H14]|uniref:MFS transporter n=1 Tax=Streptomyces sp. DW26H14 TaxID=3435395 RepID=UPI00403DC201